MRTNLTGGTDTPTAAPITQKACELESTADNKCGDSLSPIQISYSNHQKSTVRSPAKAGIPPFHGSGKEEVGTRRRSTTIFPHLKPSRRASLRIPMRLRR